jgi:hypothetical protein
MRDGHPDHRGNPRRERERPIPGGRSQYPADITRLAQATGQVDILVNNAGFYTFGSTAEFDVAAFDGIWAASSGSPWFGAWALGSGSRSHGFSLSQPQPIPIFFVPESQTAFHQGNHGLCSTPPALSLKGGVPKLCRNAEPYPTIQDNRPPRYVSALWPGVTWRCTLCTRGIRLKVPCSTN